MSDHIRFVGPFDRVLFMKGHTHTEGLNTGELGVLARVARERGFRRGRKLIEAGAPLRHWYFLVEGRARIVRNGTPTLALRSPDVVGLLEWLSESPSDFDVIAETDMITLELPTEATLEIYEDHFPILQATMRSISARTLEHLERHIVGTHRQIWPEDVDLGTRDMDLVERIVLFRRSPFFQEVSLESLAQLVSHMKLWRIPKGGQLWRSGESAEDTALILSGRVRGSLANGQIFTAGAGYPLGNVEVIAQRRRWYDARAESDVAVLRVPSELLVDMFEDQFDNALRFLREQARGLLRYFQIESELAEQDPAHAPTQLL